MRAVFISSHDNPDAWAAAMQQALPELQLDIWPNVPELDRIEAALVWKPPHGVLAGFPKLRLICSLGMGVDFLFEDSALPSTVPIVRLIDPDLIAQMSEYVCATALWHHRRFDAYRQYQQQGVWQPLSPPKTADCRIGILGLGTIGQDIAQKLLQLGFPVQGWSRTPKTVDKIQSFAGDEQLGAFLASSRILVCVLPLTNATQGIINQNTLAQLPQGAYIINVARGAHVVEADLLEAINQGHIAGAALDVFEQEPPPAGHPFWQHPKILMTPHIAGLTRPEAAAPQIAANLRRLARGETLRNQVNGQRQY